MDNFDKFYKSALRFLSFRPRSEKELIDYLNKKLKTQNSKLKNISENEKLIKSIIEKLEEQKFLNDEEFAKWWIEQRTVVRPRAWRVIKSELKIKGIDEDLIKNHESRIMNQDEEMAKKLAEKRVNKYRNLPREEFYKKMSTYLASKGFDYETIKKAIDRLLNE